MGEVLLSPLIEPVPRRVLAGATAVFANLLLLALVFAVPRPEHAARELPPFEITLVTLPEPVVETQEETVTPDDHVEDDQPETRPAEAPNQVPALTAAPLPPQTDDEDEPAAITSLQAFTGPMALPNTTTATQSVLQSVFCSTTSQFNREGLPCPDQTGPAGGVFARSYSDEELTALQAAFGLNLSPDQIRALFTDGLPVRDLAGQPTVSSQHSQHTSSADSMRDSLPPLHPDPAFGD